MNKGATVDCTITKKKSDKVVAKKVQAPPPPPPPPGAAGQGGFAIGAPPPPIMGYYGSELDDSCSDDQYCMVTSGQGYFEDGASGHCCPKPKLSCPIGEPHSNATCGGLYGSPLRSDNNNNAEKPFCPYQTHTCIRVQYTNSFEASVCCPVACSNEHVMVKGQCYPRRQYGDQCDVDEQCKGFTGSCVKGMRS